MQLLKIAKGLNEGYDMMGNALTLSTNLALGAVVNPNFEPLDLQLLKMEKKIEAGAQFFQTQAVYDPRVFEKMAKNGKVRRSYPIWCCHHKISTDGKVYE